VKQTTCTAAATDYAVVYQCIQCSGLYVSLACLREHELAEHSDKTDLISCGFVEKVHPSVPKAMCCLHNSNIGCGLCGNIFWTVQEAKSCFFHHSQTIINSACHSFSE